MIIIEIPRLYYIVNLSDQHLTMQVNSSKYNIEKRYRQRRYIKYSVSGADRSPSVDFAGISLLRKGTLPAGPLGALFVPAGSTDYGDLARRFSGAP